MADAGRPFLIAGAGPGGLALAILLRRAEIDARVVEKAQGPRTGGGALVLWPHGTRALAAVLGEGPARALGPAFRRVHVRGWTGALTHDLPIGKLAAGGGGWLMALERGRLIDALLGALGREHVRWGAPVESATTEGDRVCVRLDGGEEIEAAALVGADGFHSKVATYLRGDVPPRLANMVAWIGSSPTPGSDATRLTSTDGQGRRFLHIPHATGSWWYAYTHASFGVADMAALRACFRGYPPPITDLIATTPDGSWLRFELQDRPPSTVWGTGRISLLGDAAHPCTPDLGQGVCMALEDAVVLAATLASEAGPTEAAFRRYEGQRSERTAGLQRASWAVSQVSCPGSEFAAQVRDTVFSAVPAAALLSGFAAMFADPAAQATGAKPTK